MKKKVIPGAIVLTLALAAVAVSQTPSGPKHHTVFAHTDAKGGSWKVLPLHVKNLQKAFENDGGVQAEVVFFGQGLNMLRKTNTDDEAALKAMADSGVTLVACQNAMKAMNIKSEDLFPFVKEVDSAVAELTRKQEAGWAFIH
jgi:intracellular sulfur oxidation DsrE/DsrF family protein